jgi:serpin B
MPRLTVRRPTDLKLRLQARGLEKLFEQATCDLSGLNSFEQLYVSGAFHQAFVGVDEKGIEAAAATAIVVNGESAIEPPPVRLDVDRPFTFVIRDEALALPLFVGVVRSTD